MISSCLFYFIRDQVRASFTTSKQEVVIEQILELFDKIDLDELGMKHLIDAEVARYNKMRASLLGIKEHDKADDINVRKYAKYILREGTMVEKRELLSNLKNKIILKDRKIALGK